MSNFSTPLDEIIPANPLITGHLFQIQNSLPDTWIFAVLHYGECINASVIRENCSLTLYFWKWYGLGIKRNGQHFLFNTCKVQQSRSNRKDQQDLYHQVTNNNHVSMLLALSEAHEGQHYNLFQDGRLAMRQSKKRISSSIFLCKSIFALILHTEPTSPVEREWFAKGTQQTQELELCNVHSSVLLLHPLSQQLYEISVPKISPLRFTSIRAKQ